MNKAEQIAYMYLLNLGYKPEHITFNYRKSPDFLTNDGKGWEVKTLVANTSCKKIALSRAQLSMPLDTIILIVIKEKIFEIPLFIIISDELNIHNSYDIYRRENFIFFIDFNTMHIEYEFKMQTGGSSLLSHALNYDFNTMRKHLEGL